MSAGWAQKRFWKEVSVVATAEGAGFEIRLDGRPVRTPGKSPLLLPTRGVADMLAAEWAAQEDVINPHTMPATRMANSAIEKVTPARRAVVDHLMEYGETDLLCYRAEAPDALVIRQAAAWDPWLAWAETRFGARLSITAGVIPVAQPPGSLIPLEQKIARYDPFRLAAFYDLVTLPGSLVLGLAAAADAASPEALWQAARTDEIWQFEQWGEDAEAEAMNATEARAFAHAHRFFHACESPK